MTVAPVVSGAPVRASVKRYDADSGCGFLMAEDGKDEIFCHASALEAIGLARLVAGATVTCEVAPGRLERRSGGPASPPAPRPRPPARRCRGR